MTVSFWYLNPLPSKEEAISSCLFPASFSLFVSDMPCAEQEKKPGMIKGSNLDDPPSHVHIIHLIACHVAKSRPLIRLGACFIRDGCNHGEYWDLTDFPLIERSRFTMGKSKICKSATNESPWLVSSMNGSIHSYDPVS